MRSTGLLISRYILANVLPYFIFSWLILSVILFVQQASRYSEIFFSISIPAELAWQLSLALIPNVIAFTCPMAVLIGTMIGLTKMQGDSELVAIRAAGVGTLQITIPIMILGIVLSAFAFTVNLKGVPLAAALVRRVALQSAIKKLESPVELGVFNSAVAGYTMYVQSGDVETGRWENVFIYSEDKNAQSIRVITSSSGRIDTAGQSSELVLENASVTTLPLNSSNGNYASENIGEVRLAVRTSRSDLIQKMTNSEISADEMGLQELSTFAAGREGKEKTEAYLLWQRRVLLSVTPFIFCILGTLIVLRFGRGSRGFGVAAALTTLIFYYLLAFLGEQLARVGALPAFFSSLIPLAGSVLLLAWLAFARRVKFSTEWGTRLQHFASAIGRGSSKVQLRNVFVDLTTGLRDFDIVRNLLKNFLLTLIFLTSIFLIFTAFELWKFAGTFSGGTVLLLKYLFYLLPYVYLQIAPSATMVAVLATYVIKSRQNEVVTWASAGQSVYRLLVPCMVLTVLLGAANWVLQETVAPYANELQDRTRTKIRSGGVETTGQEKYWAATGKYIMSFTAIAEDDNASSRSRPIMPASDNERGSPPSFLRLIDVQIFQLAADKKSLQALYRADSALWGEGKLVSDGLGRRVILDNGKAEKREQDNLLLATMPNPLGLLSISPGHLPTSELRARRDLLTSDAEIRNTDLIIERRYATLFIPFVIGLITAPFALSLSRRGKAVTIGGAVALWLLFVGTSSLVENLSVSGMLPANLAVWGPMLIFAMLGIFLLSKVKT